MDVKIFPNRLDGTLEASSDKAYEHRAFVLSALCDGETEVIARNVYDDTLVTLDCLKTLGATAEKSEKGYKIRGGIKAEDAELDVKNSQATIRFLVPIACSTGAEIAFMSENPKISETKTDNFYSLKGVAVNGEKLPFSVSGKLACGEYDAETLSDSRFISSLMMALPTLDGDSLIKCGNSFRKKSYVRLTRNLMEKFGVRIDDCDEGLKIKGNQKYVSPSVLAVEGNGLTYANFFCANAFGNRVRVTGLPENSVQSEKNCKNLLLAFNAKGTSLDVKDCQDLCFILSVVACYSCSETVIKNVPKGKNAETMNYFATCLNKLGASVSYSDGELRIQGRGGVKGGAIVDSFGDGRIAMALAMLSTCADEPVTLLSAHAVTKYCPTFFNDFKMLGGKCSVL